MRSNWIGICLTAFALTTPGKAFAGPAYAPEDAIRYTLAGSLGRGQEGPAAGLNLGFHFGPLMIGAMAMGASEFKLWPTDLVESHEEGALLVGYSHINRLMFMEMAAGISLSHYVRQSAGIPVDTSECPEEFADKCGLRYGKLEKYPWGIPLEATLGLHSYALGLGLTLGANYNGFTPDNYVMLRVWTGFDKRFSAFNGPGQELARIIMGPEEEETSAGTSDRTEGKPFLSGLVATLQGLGLWIEKRWEFPHVYLSAGGGSSYELSDVGDPRADWTVFPSLQVGHSWGRTKRILTLSTGVGLLAGRDGDEMPDLFAFNVPLQLTYLYRFRTFAPGLTGGFLFNEPRAGYFLGLVTGF